MQRLQFQKLEWDSSFFGYPVSRITTLDASSLSHVFTSPMNGGVCLAYWFVDSKDKASIEVAKEENFFLADEKVTYIRKVEKEGFTPDNHVVSYLYKPLTPELINLAVQSGVYSRFRKDPHFGEEVFKKLYTLWIANSLSGEIAEDVFVYEESGIPVGLITVGSKNGRADIGILAVDEKMRGKGIGTLLIQAASMWATNKGYKEIQVVTQKENIPACRLYEKMGFQIEGIENVYHIWFT